jgi:hypothetical protein
MSDLAGPFAASPPHLEVQDSPEGFGAFNPVEARHSAERNDRVLRKLTWLRIVVTVGAILGTSLGAGLGAVRLGGDLGETTVAVIGGLVGLLVGLSVGVVIGVLYAVDRKAGGRKDPTDLLSKLLTKGNPTDLVKVVGLLLGIIGARGLRRVEPWDLILVGTILGALAGAVYGAELFLQGMGDVYISWWTVIGGVAGGLVGGGNCLVVIAVCWRRQ